MQSRYPLGPRRDYWSVAQLLREVLSQHVATLGLTDNLTLQLMKILLVLSIRSEDAGFMSTIVAKSHEVKSRYLHSDSCHILSRLRHDATLEEVRTLGRILEHEGSGLREEDIADLATQSDKEMINFFSYRTSECRLATFLLFVFVVQQSGTMRDEDNFRRLLNLMDENRHIATVRICKIVTLTQTRIAVAFRLMLRRTGLGQRATARDFCNIMNSYESDILSRLDSMAAIIHEHDDFEKNKAALTGDPGQAVERSIYVLYTQSMAALIMQTRKYHEEGHVALLIKRAENHGRTYRM
jgi:hypothetical protein